VSIYRRQINSRKYGNTQFKGLLNKGYKESTDRTMLVSIYCT